MQLNIDPNWTLFLDRDGVINHRLPGDYVKRPDEFEFLPGVEKAIAHFSGLFKRIVVVTNQQGIGKGLMTAADLEVVHNLMLDALNTAGGRIDKVYFCPELAAGNPLCRKPNPGMGLQAKQDFPEINFEKSLMVGDSISDMEFGRNLNMTTVWIQSDIPDQAPDSVDFTLPSLSVLAEKL